MMRTSAAFDNAFFLFTTSFTVASVFASSYFHSPTSASSSCPERDRVCVCVCVFVCFSPPPPLSLYFLYACILGNVGSLNLLQVLSLHESSHCLNSDEGISGFISGWVV